MKVFFKVIALVLYFAFFFGFLMPFLISAKSTIAFMLGVLAAILTLAAITYSIIKLVEGK